MPKAKTTLTDADYERLAQFRYGLRRFLHWSEQQARAAGVTPTQHQLLLAIRASRTPGGATVGEVADVLIIRHHSAVELIDRTEKKGLISRERDSDQQSVVHLQLTELGALTLSSLSGVHLRELAQLAPTIQALLGSLDDSDDVEDLLLKR
ncbi:MAG TPA: MarR family transcriptional regulator [Solirubrobacteraceae bacterium]|nr:MarR family transcriptional regulator [Solirubrobacteraceae bacterium]